MSILDRLRSFGRAKPKASKQEYFLNDPGLIPYLVGKDEISEGIFSVISRVSNVFASLPLKMIDVEFGQPDDCPAYNLLSEGPRYFTKFDFFRDVEVFEKLPRECVCADFPKYQWRSSRYGVSKTWCLPSSD